MLSPVVEDISVQPPRRLSVTHLDAATILEGIDDWPIVRTERLHALVVGPAKSVDAVLARELHLVGCPMLQWSEAEDFVRPDVSPTVVMREVDQLSSLQQERLLDWLQQNPTVQVISTASSPVYPLVENGRFLAALYYRLNVFSFFLKA